MDQTTYDDKLRALTEIFQGDGEFARQVLTKWLQQKKAEFEAAIIAEVDRRLAGINSVVPVNLRLIIDGQGARLITSKPAAGPAASAKSKAARPKKSGDAKNPLFEPQG